MAQHHWWMVNFICLFPGFHPEEKPKHSFPWEIHSDLLQSEMASKGGDWVRRQEKQDRVLSSRLCDLGQSFSLPGLQLMHMQNEGTK